MKFKFLVLLFSSLVLCAAHCFLPVKAESVSTFPLTSTTVSELAEKQAPSVVSLEISAKEKKKIPSFLDSIDYGGFKIQRYTTKIKEQEAKIGDGSGFIISSDGYIVTNQHVISPSVNNIKIQPSKIEVIMYDGKRYLAEVIGEDEDSDIAVIKIKANNLKPIQWGDSSLVKAGEFGVTIGSSLGADHTVGFGIISAVSRKKPQVSREALFGDLDYIQTYAQINPGNSGGPLLNMKGEVIGITSFIQLAPHTPGFAIPSNYAKRIATALIADGKVKRPAVGLGLTIVRKSSSNSSEDPNSENNFAALVTEVLEGGPASKAGFKAGDIISKVNGKDINLPQDFTHEIRSYPVGSNFTVEVLRNNNKKVELIVKSGYLD